MTFRDRREAGRRLAGRLGAYAGRRDVLVLGLPRGGVPVAFEVARALGAPLDLWVVRKVGVPGYEELAMGAVASGGVRVLNAPVVDALRLPAEELEDAVEREERELSRRERIYRGGRPVPEPQGKTVIVVDDGLATGSTMKAAVEALRRRGAARIVVAAPVSSREAVEDLGGLAEEVVCDEIPGSFGSIGGWYEDFEQTTDEEVRSLLEEGRRAEARPGGASG